MDHNHHNPLVVDFAVEDKLECARESAARFEAKMMDTKSSRRAFLKGTLGPFVGSAPRELRRLPDRDSDRGAYRPENEKALHLVLGLEVRDKPVT